MVFGNVRGVTQKMMRMAGAQIPHPKSVPDAEIESVSRV